MIPLEIFRQYDIFWHAKPHKMLDISEVIFMRTEFCILGLQYVNIMLKYILWCHAHEVFQHFSMPACWNRFSKNIYSNTPSPPPDEDEWLSQPNNSVTYTNQNPNQPKISEVEKYKLVKAYIQYRTTTGDISTGLFALDSQSNVSYTTKTAANNP